MVGPRNSKEPPRSPPRSQPSGATRRTAVGLLLGAPLLGACSGIQQTLSQYTTSGPAQEPVVAGTGQVKVGLILPLSAPGNAGVAAQSMKNAAEMALAEFQNPNIQLLIKDDAGNPQGAQQGTQQALDEGAEIILGPLFAASVPATAQLARTRGVSVIAFSTDSSVAGRGRSEERRPRIRRQPDHRILRRHRKAVLRCAIARECLWQCGGGRIQAGGGPQGRAHRRV